MIFQETLQIPCIDEVMNIEEKKSWITPIIHFLKWENLPNDKKEARKIERRLVYFFIENK